MGPELAHSDTKAMVLNAAWGIEYYNVTQRFCCAIWGSSNMCGSISMCAFKVNEYGSTMVVITDFVQLEARVVIFGTDELLC
jgi:hypothetical protein